MPDLESIQRDLELYLETNWVSTEKEFANSEEGATGTEHVPLSQGDASYISIQVHHNVSRAAEVGAGLNGNKRSDGILEILIHVRRGRGTRAVSQYLDSLKALLEYKDDIGSALQVESFTVAPGFPQDKWFVTPVLYNFYFHR